MITRQEMAELYHREIILGGPPGDAGMRFSLSAYEGFVLLAQLEGSPPRGEVVNNNLAEFVQFLYLFEMFRTRASDDPVDLEELRKTLTSIDPFSFEQAEDWWAMALHHVSGGGIFW